MVHLHELPDILTVEEATAYLRLGRNTVYAAVRSGALPSIRIGRRILIPKQALERFLTQADAAILTPPEPG